MTTQPLQTLKGFRDFLPTEKRARDYVARTIAKTFERYGFAPLETPTLEYASLLLGKYGDEADKLVYTFEDKGERAVGLRYDQTVPTARVLSQYRNDLPKYFRRYQMQNVFRADKPQKGRYREFMQCDADIFGTTSPTADAEIIAVTYDAFDAIGFETIRILVNDRETLIATLAPFTTNDVDVFSIIQSVDKLDKLPAESVAQELIAKGLSTEAANEALHAIQAAKPSDALLAVIASAKDLGVPEDAIVFTPTLARGLDYYTGTIYEVTMPIEGFSVGSFAGGGRYDNLIGDLGGQPTPAVGIAFGFDRVVHAAQALSLIPDSLGGPTVLVAVFDRTAASLGLKIAQELRAADIRTELYPELGDKPGKQLSYADSLSIPWVAIVGERELTEGTVTLKDMVQGDQQTVTLDELVDAIV